MKNKQKNNTKPCDTLYAKKLGEIQLNFHKSNLLKILLQLKVSQLSTTDKNWTIFQQLMVSCHLQSRRVIKLSI